MKVVGFDLSSRKLAMFTLDVETGEPGSHGFIQAPTKMKSRPEVLAYFYTHLYDEMLRSLPEDEQTYVFVEHPLVGRAGAHATIVQAQVQGIVMLTSVRFGASGVYEVNVQSWKKAVVGHGGANKERVKSWLGEHHSTLSQLAGDDQDLVDAACVSLYGLDVIRRGEKLGAESVQLDPG